MNVLDGYSGEISSILREDGEPDHAYPKQLTITGTGGAWRYWRVGDDIVVYQAPRNVSEAYQHAEYALKVLASQWVMSWEASPKHVKTLLKAVGALESLRGKDGT